MYKNRNFAKQGASCAVVDSNSGEISKTKLRQNFPKGKGIRCSLVEKMPLFTRQKCKSLMGKAAGKHHFVPTSWKKGKPLEDLCVGIIYKTRSTLNIFKCLYHILIKDYNTILRLARS